MSAHLQHVLLISLRILSAALGSMFLYMAMFMYADERGRQQNRLVNLWIQVKQKEEASLSREGLLMKSASRLASNGLNALFGQQLISLQTLVVSASFSLASAAFLYADEEPQFFSIASIFLGFLFLFNALFAAPLSFQLGQRLEPCLILGAYLIPFLTVLLSSYIFPLGYREVVTVLLPTLLIGILFGVLCDVILIATIRKIFRDLSLSAKGSTLFFGVVLNLVLSYLLADSVLLGTLSSLVEEEPLCRFIVKHLNVGALSLVAFAASTNLFALLISCSVLFVIGAAIVHPFVWPVIGRIVNAVYEWEIFTNKKLQLTLGIGFVALAIPQVGRILKTF